MNQDPPRGVYQQPLRGESTGLGRLQEPIYREFPLAPLGAGSQLGEEVDPSDRECLGHTLPKTNLEVENHLFVVDFMVFLSGSFSTEPC